MTHDQLSSLCSLLMVSDPWPLDQHELKTLTEFANEKAGDLGYQSWIDAYHEINKANGQFGS